MAKVISLYYTTYDVDAISVAQTMAAAGYLTIDGILLDGPNIVPRTVQFNYFQRPVAITSSGDDSGVNFTVTGEDFNGNVISETLAGANADVAVTTTLFSRVTSIYVDGATDGDVEIGLDTTGVSWLIPIDYRNQTIKYLSTFNVTGTVNYTFNFTGDDVYNTPYDDIHWVAVGAGTTAATTDQTATSITPVTAFEVVINSSSDPGELDVRIVESGISA